MTRVGWSNERIWDLNVVIWGLYLKVKIFHIIHFIWLCHESCVGLQRLLLTSARPWFLIVWIAVRILNQVDLRKLNFVSFLNQLEILDRIVREWNVIRGFQVRIRLIFAFYVQKVFIISRLWASFLTKIILFLLSFAKQSPCCLIEKRDLLNLYKIGIILEVTRVIHVTPGRSIA